VFWKVSGNRLGRLSTTAAVECDSEGFFEGGHNIHGLTIYNDTQPTVGTPKGIRMREVVPTEQWASWALVMLRGSLPTSSAHCAVKSPQKETGHDR